MTGNEGEEASEAEMEVATTIGEGITTEIEIRGISEISNAKDQEVLTSIAAEAEVAAAATRNEESTRLEAHLTQAIADLYRQHNHNTIILSADHLPTTAQFLLSSHFCTCPYHASSHTPIPPSIFFHLAILLSLFLPLHC